MKKWFILLGIGAIFLGLLWRNLFLWFPYRLVRLFAPANASAWEHLKLLFWPPVLATLILAHRFGQSRIWCAFSPGLLLMPLAALGLHYFGLSRLAPCLYPLICIGGFALAYRRAGRAGTDRLGGVCLMLAGIYGSALVLFSVAAPPFSIFLP